MQIIKLPTRLDLYRTIGAHNLIVSFFERAWKKQLVDPFTEKPCKVIQVRGWRSCLLDTPSGCRQTVTFLFARESLNGI